MIKGQNFSNQPVKINLRTYDNTQKIATGQGDKYATGCLIDYPYFKSYYKMITIDLGKNNKHLMLTQKQYRKSILLQIQIEEKT